MSHEPTQSRIEPLGRWRPGARIDGPGRLGRTGRRPDTARWRAWAAAFAGRHAPGRATAARAASARIGSPAMRLRRAARLARDATQRRQAPALHFFPTVRLSIGPFLRRDFWRTGVAAAAPPTPWRDDSGTASRRDRSAVDRPAVAGPAGTTAAARGRSGGASGLVFLARGGPAGHAGSRREPQRPGTGAGTPARTPLPPLSSQRQMVAAVPAPGPAPLALVLRRLRAAQGGAGQAAHRADAGSPAGAGEPGGARRVALARGLAARLSRQEALPLELPPAALLVPAGPRREPAAAGRGHLTGRAAGAVSPWDEPSSSGSSRLAGWGERARPPAASPPPQSLPMPSVEALADRVMQQIDRRLGAWRDRTGAF